MKPGGKMWASSITSNHSKNQPPEIDRPHDFTLRNFKGREKVPKQTLAKSGLPGWTTRPQSKQYPKVSCTCIHILYTTLIARKFNCDHETSFLRRWGKFQSSRSRRNMSNFLNISICKCLDYWKSTATQEVPNLANQDRLQFLESQASAKGEIDPFLMRPIKPIIKQYASKVKKRSRKPALAKGGPSWLNNWGA